MLVNRQNDLDPNFSTPRVCSSHLSTARCKLWFSEVITILLVRSKIQSNCSLATGIKHLYFQSEMGSFLLSGRVGVLSKTPTLIASAEVLHFELVGLISSQSQILSFLVSFLCIIYHHQTIPVVYLHGLLPRKNLPCPFVFLTRHKPRVTHGALNCSAWMFSF